MGTTVYRATIVKAAPAQKFVFESTEIRHSSHLNFRHAYQNELDIVDPDWQPSPDDQAEDAVRILGQSIIFYRYYEGDSELLGNGKAQERKSYALGLNDLIIRFKH